MKANELRINNYVYPFDDINYVDCKVLFRDSILVSIKDLEDTSNLNPIPLTDEWILRFEEFNETDKEGTPCFFNGDNIMLFDRKGCFDAYLHSEIDGSVFFATRLFYVHQLQNFYHAIERQDLTIRL